MLEARTVVVVCSCRTVVAVFVLALSSLTVWLKEAHRQAADPMQAAFDGSRVRAQYGAGIVSAERSASSYPWAFSGSGRLTGLRSSGS
jgi:hypothetical protein